MNKGLDSREPYGQANGEDGSMSEANAFAKMPDFPSHMEIAERERAHAFKDEMLGRYEGYCKEHNLEMSDKEGFYRELEAELARLCESKGIEPDDLDIKSINPKDPFYADFHPLLDLFTACLLHNDVDVRECGYLYGVCGGRYDNLEFEDSGVTIREAGQFNDFLDSMLDFKWGDLGSVVRGVVNDNKFGLDDLKIFQEALSYRDSEKFTEDVELAVKKPHELLAQIMYVKTTQEALAGKRDKLTENELRLIVSHVGTEHLLRNQTLSNIIVSTFEDAVENPQSYTHLSTITEYDTFSDSSDSEQETYMPFFHKTTREVLLSNLDSVSISKTQIQKLGDSIMDQTWVNDSVKADCIIFATALGFDPKDVAFGGFSPGYDMTPDQIIESAQLLKYLYSPGYHESRHTQGVEFYTDNPLFKNGMSTLAKLCYLRLPEEAQSRLSGIAAAAFSVGDIGFIQKLQPDMFGTDSMLTPSQLAIVETLHGSGMKGEEAYRLLEFLCASAPNQDEMSCYVRRKKRYETLSPEEISEIIGVYSLIHGDDVAAFDNPQTIEGIVNSPIFKGGDSRIARECFLLLPPKAQNALPEIVSAALSEKDINFLSQLDPRFLDLKPSLTPAELVIIRNLGKESALSKDKRSLFVDFLFEEIEAPTADEPDRKISRYKNLTDKDINNIVDVLSKFMNLRKEESLDSNSVNSLINSPLFGDPRSKIGQQCYLKLPHEVQNMLSGFLAQTFANGDVSFIFSVATNNQGDFPALSPIQQEIIKEARKERNLGRPSQSTQLIEFMVERVAIPTPDDPDRTIPRYEVMSPEMVVKTNSLLAKIHGSTAIELVSHAYEIAERLLQMDYEKAIESAECLERIFLRSDIPEFAKLYCTANILYEGSINDETDISPVLFESEDKRSVLMTDLLKNAIRSGNPSLRRYLEFHLHLSEEEEEEEQERSQESSDADDGLLSEFTNNKKFHTRLLGYARALGYETTRDILVAMDETRAVAHRRHIDSVERGPDDIYRLKRDPIPGDLIKSINIDYIHTMMRSGFNCPEMVGSGAHQDETHWDTDFGSFREGQVSSIDEAIRGSMAQDYGNNDGVYVGMINDERLCHTYPGDSSPYGNMRQYEAYHNGDGWSNFRGIRTGLGSYDVDYFVITRSEDRNRLAYEIAKSGCYTPVIDRASGHVVFTPEDYAAMRERFRGQPRYSEEPFAYAPNLSLPDTLRTNDSDSSLGFAELVLGYDSRERESVEMDQAISAAILERVEGSNLPDDIKAAFRNWQFSIDADYKSGHIEVISTGSTARHTNIPGSADYDYIWRIDREIYEKYGERIMSLLDGGESPLITYDASDPDSCRRGLNIRKGILWVGNTKIEIDISPTVKTNGLEYSSDIALADQLEHMKQDNPDSYRAVIANIILAKAFLKKAEAYKKGNDAAHSQGGLGGIGVENWILQNGGSLMTALGTFLDAAIDEQGQQRSWTEFKKRYTVWDFGENHLSRGNYPYNEFVYDNMNLTGYSRMVEAARELLGK